MRKEYKLRNFILDVLLLILTGGFWFIWIIIRELRNIANSRR